MLAKFRKKKKTKKRKKYNRIKKNKTREKNTRVLITLKTAGTKKRIFVAFFRSISLEKKNSLTVRIEAPLLSNDSINLKSEKILRLRNRVII